MALKERQLRVAKPRLRKKRPRAGESGEVEIPAYTALRGDRRLADRMLELVLHGVSTRKYEPVLPAMADQVGISKSEVSRETIEAGTRVLQELAERDLSELDVLVVYLDGIQFGDYHVLAAVGVDADGRKHVLGLCGGASENTPVTIGLLEDLVARGLRADRRRLFVIDGAQALRKAIGQVFGASHLVQRCRNHKLRNVLGHLPKEQHEQARSTLRAAWKLDADEGIRKLEQYASWLEREWPSAAASLREGLPELFTVNRLGLPQSLRRCLTTTNIIDSSHAGVRQHTDRVSRWRNEEMAVRWAAVTFRETLEHEKHFAASPGTSISGCLKAHLDEGRWRPCRAEGGVTPLTFNYRRDGWRFGDRRRLIAPTATSGPGAGGGRPLGGAKGVVGAACVVSLGGSGCKRKGLPGLMGVYHHNPRGGEPHASDYVTTAAVGCHADVRQAG